MGGIVADDRLAALEDKVARLEAALAASEARTPVAPAPAVAVTDPAVTRRRLLSGGAIAAGAAALVAGPGASPAAADPANTVTISPPITGLAALDAQAAFSELQANKAWAATVDIRTTGATTASANNATAITNAINLVVAAGGGTVLIPAGRFKFGGTITVPNGVDLWGCGGGSQNTATLGSVLQALDGAKLVFQGGGNQSGNVLVDGSLQVAAAGSQASELVLIDTTVERLFTAMRVAQSKNDLMRLAGAQNCTFVQLYLGHSARDGLVLDGNSWSHLFLRCEFTGAVGNDVRIKNAAGGVHDNLFLQCILERGGWGTGNFNGANNSALLVQGGTTNKFDNCIFAVRTPNTTTSGYVVLVQGGDVEFDSCNFTTDINGAGCLSNTAGVFFTGRNHFIAEHNDVAPGPRPAINWTSPAFGNVAGRIDFGTCPGPRWGGTAGANQQLSFETDRPHLAYLENDATFGLRVARRSEAGTGMRFQVSNPVVPADGTQIQLSDGSTFNPKALWKLKGGTGFGWETPNEVFLNGGQLAVQALTGAGNPDLSTLPTGRAVMYVKADKLVIAYREAGGTLKYKALNLTGAGITWADIAAP